MQIQARKYVPDHADYTAPTRQRELDHTDHTDEGYICPERSRSSSGNRSYRSSVRGMKSSEKGGGGDGDGVDSDSWPR